MKITTPKNRKDKKEIHEKLSKSDSLIIQAKNNIRTLDRNFYLKRDKELLNSILDKLNWCNNKLLLLEGRIIGEIGSKLYSDRQYLQFRYRIYPKDADYRTKKVVYLADTDYSGEKFNAFLNKRLEAKAQTIKYNGRTLILVILIPIEHKNKIKY